MKKTKLVIPLILVVGSIHWNCEGPPGADGAGIYLSVSPALVSVAKGSTAEITVTTNDGKDGSYTWSSSDEDIATVSSGTVTGVSEGSTLISVVGNDTKASAVAIVKVTPEERSNYSYTLDIQPMFTEDNFWFFGSDACTWCHFSNDEEAGSKHAMNLGSYAGMMKGADYPPGEPLFGESSIGQTDYDWNHALLKERLRNNRMPQYPGWEFRRDESNRDGPDISLSSNHAEVVKPHQYGGDLNAIGLLKAWVEALSTIPTTSDSDAIFSYGGVSGLTFRDDIQQFFTESDMWFPNSQACIECHFSNEEGTASYHEMDLSSFEGIIFGADAGDGSLFNAGATTENKDWSNSQLKHRLRDNRMPPNAPFLLSEDNRDGPDVWDPVLHEVVSAVDLIGNWLDAGAPQ